MPQQTLDQARAGISPVNTAIAQGYQNSALVGRFLFPQVSVGMRAGKIISFGKDQFKQVANMQRSPGGRTPRVQFGYSSSNYALVDYSIEGSLPREIQEEQLAAEKGFTIDGAQMAINNAMDIIRLRLELQQASLATTLANYNSGNKVTLSGTSQLSDYSGTSNPVAVVETGKEAIRQKIGRYPNTAVIGPTVMAAVKQHPVIIDRMKYTGRDVVTTDILSSLWGIPNVIVGEAITASDSDVFSDVWGKHIVLAYTITGDLPSRGQPTFGYTYNLGNYPIAESAYYEDNQKTWYFPVTACEAPVIAAPDAGYLIYNAVA